jgi:hypothetical protein
MDQSTRDKIMLFKTVPTKVNFESWTTLDKILKKELPELARFLLEWEIPAECMAEEKRFGIKAYHDPSLFEESMHQSADGLTTEILVQFLDSYFVANPKADSWSGCCTQLDADMRDIHEGAMRSVKARQVATCLGNLAKNGYDLKRTRVRGMRIWTIGKIFLQEQQDGIKAAHEKGSK